MNSIDLSDNELYISCTSDIDENSLKNLSWVDEFDNKEITKEELNTQKQDQNQDKNQDQDRDKIMLIRFKNLSDLKILEYQNIIIGELRKTNDSTIITDISNIIKKIDWLISASKYLSNKLGLLLFNHKNFNTASIPRSSYKFCNLNFKCDHNYNSKKRGCHLQHYVHNLIHADLCALKNYLTNNNNSQVTEIQKSINTISFVINHMYEELQFSKNHILRTSQKNNDLRTSQKNNDLRTSQKNNDLRTSQKNNDLRTSQKNNCVSSVL